MTTPRIVTAPGVRPIMQVAIGDVDVDVGQATYDAAHYDRYPEATYSGLDAKWADDSCDVIQAVTFYGRERAVDQFDVGTATLRVANPDGLWDYPPTSDDASVVSLRPGRKLRVGVIPGPDTPGYTIPGTPAVPGYLTPTVGTVTTPDPGPLPNQHTFVFKVRGPIENTAANLYPLAGQSEGPAAQAAFVIYRGRPLYTASPIRAYYYPTASTSSSFSLAPPPTGQPESFAISATLDAAGRTLETLRRWDGAAWLTVQSIDIPTQAPVFDTSYVLRVGGIVATPSATNRWNDRVYSVELRTGLDPAGGTVVWRFDADEYPGGSVTSYTDPRGRVWTLTNAAAITPKVPAVPDTVVPPVIVSPVWLWDGWIDATQPAYDPAAPDVVDVSCVCAKGEAGRSELARLATAVGDGETVTARMIRYADAVNFPAHRRQFDDTGTTLVGTTMGGRVGALMDRSARSAGGDIFGDQSGQLVYRSQDWQTRGPGVPPDAVIGNRGLAGEVCPNVWEVLFNRSDFTNRVNYGQSGGTVSTIDDAANRDKYGVESYTMTDLETVDASTRTLLAQRVLRVRSFDLAPRIAAVTLDAARPGAVAVMAAADPFTPSMYNCGLVTDGRAVFARTMYVTGVAHTIEAGRWTARLALDDAAPWQTNADTRYDAAHYDTDRYARAV